MVALDVVLATAIWAMLPAYIPNNAAVLVGGGPPIDGGRSWRGRRLLGDGKTWRGTAGGIVAGSVLAMGLNVLVEPVSAAIGVALPSFPIRAAIALPLGAMLGDITASFLKRRTGRERGAAFPGLDQLDFVLGGLVVALLFAPGWTTRVFTLPVATVVIVVTPLLHVGTNAIAYGLGLKDEPW
ncbi:MAG: CDP-2,3-bis-(O-geranylgeranyl)-sn-glycerol synthase [Halobacteriales archaeon]|nr:CDP-2,3-bis-(O-geranylgeranyl)-sn-glycerol synthase [Halobacteriales archaeon]